MLVHRSGAGGDLELTWFDRQGKVLGAAGGPAHYNSIALSPDGTRVAVSRANPHNTPNWDVWVLDLARNTSTRLTYDQIRAASPIWSADGSSVIFTALRDGSDNFYRKPASSATDEQPLLKSNGEYKYPTSSSRDGRFLLYTVETAETKDDLLVLQLEGDDMQTPLLRTEFNEGSGRFSPEGRWIAYTSDESGRDEIYVREFSPNPARASSDNGGKWLISSGGGTEPRWRGDGKELFYVDPAGRVMSVKVTNEPNFRAGSPSPLFQLPLGFIGEDVTADGKRFLVGVACGTEPVSTLHRGPELADGIEEMILAVPRDKCLR